MTSGSPPPFRRNTLTGPLLILTASLILAVAIVFGALILRSSSQANPDDASVITTVPPQTPILDPYAAGLGRSAGENLRVIYNTLPEIQAECRQSATRQYGSQPTPNNQAFYEACVRAFTS